MHEARTVPVSIGPTSRPHRCARPAQPNKPKQLDLDDSVHPSHAAVT